MSSNRISKKVKATPPVQRKSQLPKTSLANNRVPARVIRYGIAGFLNDADAHSLSRSGVNLHSALDEDFDKRALKQLLQAMIDHDLPKVTRILQCKPNLLLIEPSELGIKK